MADFTAEMIREAQRRAAEIRAAVLGEKKTSETHRRTRRRSSSRRRSESEKRKAQVKIAAERTAAAAAAAAASGKRRKRLGTNAKLLEEAGTLAPESAIGSFLAPFEKHTIYPSTLALTRSRRTVKK